MSRSGSLLFQRNRGQIALMREALDARLARALALTTSPRLAAELREAHRSVAQGFTAVIAAADANEVDVDTFRAICDGVTVSLRAFFALADFVGA